MQDKTLSVIVPAFNEGKNIEKTLKSLLKVVPVYCRKYEIIVINDGSNDNTLQIADEYAKKHKNIRVINNKVNLGMGASYWKGIKAAKNNYVILVWGDCAHTDSSLRKILKYIGKYDIVIPNYANMETRTFKRRTLSKIFTMVINLIASLDVKYYNGTTLYLKKLVLDCPRRSTGFGYQAELLAHAIKSGASYTQVNVLRKNIPDGVSAAFKLKNIWNVCKSVAWLFWQFRILRI